MSIMGSGRGIIEVMGRRTPNYLETTKMTYKAKVPTGVSLLELVVVIVFMGLVAAVVIPRMSEGSTGTTHAGLSADLAVLRNAIDMYACEHSGTYPDADNFEVQVTQYTDISGATSPTKTATHIYGPYLRKISPLPVGSSKGNTAVAANSGGNVGWKYNSATGDIRANTTGAEADAYGKLYKDY
jgi:type II secretory pathway pseudopilin PulG